VLFYCKFLYAPAAIDLAEAPVKAQARSRARAHTQAQPAATYVRLELLDTRVDFGHRSNLSAVLVEDLGHIYSHATRTLMSIHDLWVPKYM
jgi:hypothetical protein